jgi:hypothetical protein
MHAALYQSPVSSFMAWYLGTGGNFTLSSRDTTCVIKSGKLKWVGLVPRIETIHVCKRWNYNVINRLLTRSSERASAVGQYIT